jgi:hypothetical protein
MGFGMRLTLCIQSHQVVAQQFRWGKLKEAFCHPLQASSAWLDGVRVCLERFPSVKSVHVQLGAPHVQWLVETWPAHLSKRRDFQAYLEFQAEQAFQGTQKHTGAWRVGFDARARRGDSLPIAVLNAEMLQALQAELLAMQRNVKSVQPLLQSSWQTWNKYSKYPMLEHGVLAFEEKDWCTVFGVQKARLHSVRSVRSAEASVVQRQVVGYAQSLGALVDDVHWIKVGQ